MEEEPGLLDSLRRHWRVLAIFIILVAGAAIYSERALIPVGGVEEADKSAAPQARPANATPDTKPSESDAELEAERVEAERALRLTPSQATSPPPGALTTRRRP